MKKIKLYLAIVLIAVFSLTQTGCIGSFTLTKKVLDFNRDMGDKFIEEAVFIAFLIIPVYEVSTIVDAFILNLLEFWTGDNPLGYINENGDKIDVTKSDNSYTLHNLTTDEHLLVYVDLESNTVYAEINNKILKLVEYNTVTNEALVFLPKGETKLIDLNNMSAFEIRNELTKNIQFALK